MLNENRKFRRISFSEPVDLYDVRYTDQGLFQRIQGQPLNLLALNISKTGICLRTEYFLMPDRVFQLDFALRGKTIHTVAQVVWSEHNCCGMLFLRPEEISEAFSSIQELNYHFI